MYYTYGTPPFAARIPGVFVSVRPRKFYNYADLASPSLQTPRASSKVKHASFLSKHKLVGGRGSMCVCLLPSLSSPPQTHRHEINFARQAREPSRGPLYKGLPSPVGQKCVSGSHLSPPRVRRRRRPLAVKPSSAAKKLSPSLSKKRGRKPKLAAGAKSRERGVIKKARLQHRAALFRGNLDPESKVTMQRC